MGHKLSIIELGCLISLYFKSSSFFRPALYDVENRLVTLELAVRERAPYGAVTGQPLHDARITRKGRGYIDDYGVVAALLELIHAGYIGVATFYIRYLSAEELPEFLSCESSQVREAAREGVQD